MSERSPLEGVPGFHALARTCLVGLPRPGVATLAVFCTCWDRPVASIEVGDAPIRALEAGSGRVVLTPGIDLVADGHFTTDGPVEVRPDGWIPLGKVDRKAATRAAMSGTKTVKVAALRRPAPTGDERCVCQHALAFHDPCSKCSGRRSCKVFRPRK